MKNKRIKKLLAGTLASTLVSTLFSCTPYNEQTQQSYIEISYFLNSETCATTIKEVNSAENFAWQNEIDATNKNFLSINLIENVLENLLDNSTNISLKSLSYLTKEDKTILQFNYITDYAEENNLKINFIQEKDRLNSAILKFEQKKLIEGEFFAEIAFCLVNETQNNLNEQERSK